MNNFSHTCALSNVYLMCVDWCLCVCEQERERESDQARNLVSAYFRSWIKPYCDLGFHSSLNKHLVATF